MNPAREVQGCPYSTIGEEQLAFFIDYRRFAGTVLFWI